MQQMVSPIVPSSSTDAPPPYSYHPQPQPGFVMVPMAAVMPQQVHVQVQGSDLPPAYSSAQYQLPPYSQEAVYGRVAAASVAIPEPSKNLQPDRRISAPALPPRPSAAAVSNLASSGSIPENRPL